MPKYWQYPISLSNMKKCLFIKENQEQCNSFAMAEDVFCYFHSDKTKDQRKESVLKGGKSLKRNYGREGEVRLRKADDVLTLLEQTVEDLRNNRTNTRNANAIFILTGIALKTLEYRFQEKILEDKRKASDAFQDDWDEILKLTSKNKKR